MLARLSTSVGGPKRVGRVGYRDLVGKKHARRLLAERADRIARDLERDAMAMMRIMVANPVRYTDTIRQLDDSLADVETFTQAIMSGLSIKERHLMRVLSDYAHDTPGEDAIQMSRWAQHRIVYAVDPDAAAAVIDTDWSDTVIPGEVLRRLPHPDPMVVLPEPVEWLNTEGWLERYEAFGVFGVHGERRRASSHALDTHHMVLHFFGRECDPVTGKPRDQMLPNVTDGSLLRVVPVMGMRAVTPLTDATMKEREEYAIRDMLSGPWTSVFGFADESEAGRGMAKLTRIGLALLVYLVTDDADTQRVDLPRGGRESRAVHGPAPTVFEVGFHIGAALRQTHRDPSHKVSTGATGRTVAPHIRRAHLHTFRRGPGRSERFIKWLPPIAINADARGTQTQVHVR